VLKNGLGQAADDAAPLSAIKGSCTKDLAADFWKPNREQKLNIFFNN
jgi:hypothetical protein